MLCDVILLAIVKSLVCINEHRALSSIVMKVLKMVVYMLSLSSKLLTKCYRLAAALLLVTALAACVSTPKTADRWPSDIPEKAYYLAHYADDHSNQKIQSEEDYLKWVHRFYRGWSFYPKGWDWLIATTLKESADYSERVAVKANMVELGRLISAEWAKNTNHRQINTSHLMAWGEALKIAVKNREQVQLTETILGDVKSLLAGTLQPSDVDLQRYIAKQGVTSNATIVLADDVEFDDPFQ